MIYTVTFNPALDYVVQVPGLRPGEVNRTVREELYYGGKGINVSTILNELGVPTVAWGFVAGFTGRAIEEGVRARGVSTDFIPLDTGFSRINVKIQADGQTEINGQGPTIDEKSLALLYDKIDTLTADDTLVLAGSVPPCLPDDVYRRLLARLAGRGAAAVVDATGDLLRSVLPYRPFLIKPNHKELGELFGRTLHGEDDLIACARQLRREGARNVLVSRGGEGALLVAEDDTVHSIDALPGQAVNAVGAGDSMVAGFLAGWIHTGDYRQALRWGAAAGTATAFAPGLATRQDIDTLLHTLEQQNI